MATTDTHDPHEPSLSGQEHLTSTEWLAEEEELPGMPQLLQTPSQTIGPFFGFALPYEGGGQLVPGHLPGSVRLHGTVYDGDGIPIPDAILEIWQTDADGRIPQEPGSIARQRGRFTGFGRTAVEDDGSFEFITLLPGPAQAGGPRFALVTVFGRGITHHVFTRAYFVGEGEPDPTDALLERVPAERRETLFARQDGPDSYRFDIRYQGENETVFLDYPGAPAGTE